MTRRVIDSHLHVWERDRNPQTWIDSVSMSVIDRDFTPQDAVAQLRESAVDGCVVVQCVNTFSETLDLLSGAEPFAPILGIVGWVDLEADVTSQLDILRAAPGGSKLVGIRHVTTMEADESWLARPKVASGLKALATADVPFDVIVRPWQLPLVANLARTLNTSRFVLDHMGKPALTSSSLAQWSAELKILAAHENVDTKVSGLITEDDWSARGLDRLRPVVDHALEVFGPSRLMFGSDWPLAELAGGYQRWKDAYEELTAGLSAAEQAAIDSGNARRVYGLR